MDKITENITVPLEYAKQILDQDVPKRGEQLVALIYLSDVYKYLNIAPELHADMTLEAIRNYYWAAVYLSRPNIHQAAATEKRFQDAWKSA